MSKGITVVDIPEYCDYCPNGRIFGINSAVECLVAPEGTCVSGHGLHVKRPDWCPIKELPMRHLRRIMCTKQCDCNRCYKKKTCADCPYCFENKDIDCNSQGIQGCKYKIDYPSF